MECREGDIAGEIDLVRPLLILEMEARAEEMIRLLSLK